MSNFTANQLLVQFKFEWAKFLSIFKFFSVSLLVSLTFLFLDVDAAFAHGPHDEVAAVEISPNYDQDQTIYHIARLNELRGSLFKSEDGGQSWKRIEKGLDNKDKLNSLDISSQSKKTLFLSSGGDGIYKSQDGGASWVKVSKGLGTLNIDLVSISPDSSDVVLAAGAEKGLYKTKNGGESWHQVLDSENQITAIAFSSEQKDHIVIGDTQGILYESKDGGEDWKQLFSIPNSGAIRAIAVSPNFSSDKTFFVGTEKGGIFKTVDGGISFKEVNEGLSDRAILSLGMSPDYGTDSTVFASTWQQGVFRSNDGGNTWQKYSKGLTKARQADQWERPHFSDLRISPTFSQDKTIFLGGFDGLFKSTDGGRSWRDMYIAYASSRTIKSLALSPNYQNDSTVAISTFGEGAYISNDQGVTWTRLTALNKSTVNRDYLKQNQLSSPAIHFSPNYRSDKTILSGTRIKEHFLKSEDGGKHWKITRAKNSWWLNNTKSRSWWLNNTKSSRYADHKIAVSPNFASDNTIYFGNSSGDIIRSTDGGKTFSLVGNAGQIIYSLVISPDFSSDKTLYAGCIFFGKEDERSRNCGVSKTVDGGYTWQPVNKGLTLRVGSKKLAISPSYKVDKTVFVGTERGLFATKDGGKIWRKVAGTAYGGDGWIQTLAISPNYQSDQTFIVSVKGRGLFKTVNGGKTFTKIGDYLSGQIKFSPSYSIDKTIYGASAAELFKSTDGGNTWETLTIPKLNYNSIDFLYLRLTLFPKSLYLSLTRSPKRRFLAASIAALLSYLLLGYLGLEKRLPFRKWQIRAGGAFATLIVVLILLSAL